MRSIRRRPDRQLSTISLMTLIASKPAADQYDVKGRITAETAKCFRFGKTVDLQ